MAVTVDGNGSDAVPGRVPRRAASRVQHRSTSSLPDEIVQRSILLFNRDGPENVSTNLIAADLGISSGNLHYHFRTKQDLGRALYDLMEGDLRHALRDTDAPADVPHLVDRQIEMQRCLWRHRYFFAGFDLFTRKDAAMRDQFAHLQQWGVTRIIRLLNHYTTAKVLRPIEAPNSPLLFAQNLWMLWMGWVRWEVVMGDKDMDATAENAVIHRLSGHHFSFLAILMRQDLATEVSAQRGRALAPSDKSKAQPGPLSLDSLLAGKREQALHLPCLRSP